jgi:hypothetical protein
MSDFCPGCGTEHHWLACPEVSQSVFPADDPEWQDEEPPPPMVPVGPSWDPGTPEWDRVCLTTSQ